MKRNNLFIRLYKEALEEPLKELSEGLDQLSKCSRIIRKSIFKIIRVSIGMFLCSTKAIWFMAITSAFEGYQFGAGFIEEMKRGGTNERL